MSSLEAEYRQRFEMVLKPLARSIEARLVDHLKDVPRIDRIVARAKSVDRFLKKAAKLDDHGKPKYDDPLSEIQDQIGARVIVFYGSDARPVTDITSKYLNSIENKSIEPKSTWSFGYFGQHFISAVPIDLIDRAWDKEIVPEFFELQVKTLFQHAWSEAEHDLGYKPEAPLGASAERRLAFTGAQAWGADLIFQELFQEQQRKMEEGAALADSVSPA